MAYAELFSKVYDKGNDRPGNCSIEAARNRANWRCPVDIGHYRSHWPLNHFFQQTGHDPGYGIILLKTSRLVHHGEQPEHDVHVDANL